MKQMKDDIQEIKMNLKEHMRRTAILESLHGDNQTRIEMLEGPVKARQYIINAVIDISKFTGFIVSILAILKVFSVI